MKRIFIIILLLYYSFCTIEECDTCEDQTKCNSIAVEESILFCFKAEHFESEFSEEGIEKVKCSSFPKEAENQKILKRIFNGFLKEGFSAYGKQFEEFGDDYSYDTIKYQLLETEKESYNTDEVIKFVPGTLSTSDINKLKSEKTCLYYLYGPYFANNHKKYDDISDKNICFNVQQFDEFKDLIDCGYAIFKFKVNGKDYEIKSCYLIPTANLPEIFNNQITSNIQNDINDGLLSKIISYVSGTGEEADDDDGRRRRLSITSYSIEVENKYGRKIKYSGDGTKTNLEIVAEGNSGNKGVYMDLKLLNLIILFLLFVF